MRGGDRWGGREGEETRGEGRRGKERIEEERGDEGRRGEREGKCCNIHLVFTPRAALGGKGERRTAPHAYPTTGVRGGEGR